MIDPVGATQVQAWSVNAAGEVAGFYSDATGNHGFTYIGGSFKTLDVPTATPGTTLAFGINDFGTVSGYFTGLDGHNHGFVYDGASYGTIDVPFYGPAPFAGNTKVYRINNSGDLVGSYDDAQGFSFSGGTFRHIQPPSVTSGTYPLDIDDAGLVAGLFYSPKARGMLFDGTNYQTVHNPLAVGSNGGEGTYLYGMNNVGDLVGDFADGSGTHGFILSGGLYTTVYVPGAYKDQTNVRDINDSGTVVGFFSDGGHLKGFVATVGSLGAEPSTFPGPPETGPGPTDAVPEPAAWALMIGGLGLVGSSLRRRSLAT